MGVDILNPLKQEIHLYNIYEFSTYLTENMVRLHDRDQSFHVALRKIRYLLTGSHDTNLEFCMCICSVSPDEFCIIN